MHSPAAIAAAAAILIAVVVFVLRRGNKGGFDAAAKGAVQNAAADIEKAGIAAKAALEKVTKPKA
jgi:cbb3-type cytochrome oxidase subunit 3